MEHNNYRCKIVQDCLQTGNANYDRVAVCINLYYEENLDYYAKNILEIPESIDCFIYSSNENVLHNLKSKITHKKNIRFCLKPNRGRDISTLLVEFKKEYARYEYFCFLHDKQSKHVNQNEDIALWVSSMWQNLLMSESNIYNLLGVMANSSVGLIVPPSPIGKIRSEWYRNTWYRNYDLTCKLAKELCLQVDINEDEQPVALGTAFWCKSEALSKLMDHDWKYEDFPCEPLEDDGTINHAIERILPYVARDSGFETLVVMNTEYAEKFIGITHEIMYESFALLHQELGIENAMHLSLLSEERSAVINAKRSGAHIYIYGAGQTGIHTLNRMKLAGITVDGFLVSEGYKNTDLIGEYKVYELEEILPDPDVFVIIAVSKDFVNTCVDNLKNAGCDRYYSIYLN